MLDKFAFYGLQPALLIDEAALRLKYLEFQRLWHPDFFASNPIAQLDAVAKTAKNNEDFKTLQNFHNRVQYFLQEYGLWNEGEKHTLPQDFLMEMLDLNDEIDLAKTGNSEQKEKVRVLLTESMKSIENHLIQHAQLADSEPSHWSKDYFGPLRQTYEKLRYLTRLKGNLDGNSEY